MTTDAWPRRQWAGSSIHVGPCAWSASVLLGPDAGSVRTHPSLIVIDPDTDSDTLQMIAPQLVELRGDGPSAPSAVQCPVALGVAEPAFARRLPDLVRDRIAALQISSADLLVLWVEDPADLKGGALMQSLHDLRERGEIGEIGLGHTNPLAIEWMAINTAARFLVFPYNLSEQSAAYRAIQAAHDHSMGCLALQGSEPSGVEAVRFALGRADDVLPVMAGVPDGLTPMTAQQLAVCWADYQATHPPPPSLKRGLPPVL